MMHVHHFRALNFPLHFCMCAVGWECARRNLVPSHKEYGANMKQPFTITIALTIFFLLAIVTAGPLSGDKKEDPLRIFKSNGCTTCHSIVALDITVSKSAEDEAKEDDDLEPPDLSAVGTRHDAQWISKFIAKKIDKDGKKHKRRFKGSNEERRSLATWLASLEHELPDSVSAKQSKATDGESDEQ